jgi:hypothetical protein
MTKPCIPVPEETAVGHSTPYTSFIHVLQTVMFCLKELEKLIEDGDQIPFILKTSSITIRVCRALLPAALVAFDSCIRWRSTQPMPENIDDSASSDDNGSDSPTAVDWGALSLLGAAADWAMSCSVAVGRFGTALKEKIILPGNLKVSSGIIRALPAMQNDVATFQTKMLRTAKVHGISTSRMGTCQLSTIVETYREKTECVLHLYKNILGTPISAALFDAAERETFVFHGLSSARNHSHAHGEEIEGLVNDVPTSFDLFFDPGREELAESSFTTVRSGNGDTGMSGWGIYSSFNDDLIVDDVDDNGEYSGEDDMDGDINSSDDDGY